MADWTLTLLKIGTTVATATGKALLASRRDRDERERSLAQLAGASGLNVIAIERLRRQVSQIAETIYVRLSPLVEQEFRQLDENQKDRAVAAAAEAVDDRNLTDQLILSSDVNEHRVRTSLEPIVAEAKERWDLSENESELCDAVITGAISHLVELIISIPSFQGRALRELLERESEIADTLREMLSRMPSDIRSHRSEVAEFELLYRREIARRFDRVEIFGITTAEPSRRYALDIAHIGLAVKHKGSAVDSSSSLSVGESAEAVAASSPRLLIRGEAGSGKTTLLQWLSLKCVQSSHTDPMNDWNGRLPFLVQLRKYADRRLPVGDELASAAAGNILGKTPKAWAYDRLSEGRGAVFVDGIDEFPEARRAELDQWIIDLTVSFPLINVIVTTRPAVGNLRRLEESRFVIADLLPMSDAKVRLFVKHWHEAVRIGHNESESARTEEFRSRLSAALGRNTSLRALATNPLMCAILCAINWDRGSQLPRRRMEIYRIALEMLLSRRDWERGVPLSEAVELEYDVQSVILQAVAWWFAINQYAEADRDRVEKQVDNCLRTMTKPPRATASQVVSYLIRRSGVIREPSAGKIDFLHKSFQEYLAAFWYLDSDNLDSLLTQVESPPFHNVIVMAAGASRPKEADKILRQILSAAKERTTIGPERVRLVFLAVDCLEVVAQADVEVRESISGEVEKILPPSTVSEARIVAAVGETALARLPTVWTSLPAQEASSCVHAAGLIGGGSAMDYIALFGEDRRESVHREKVRAWSYFEPESFARAAFPRGSKPWKLRVHDIDVLPGAKAVPDLASLEVRLAGDYSAPLLRRQEGLELCTQLSIIENSAIEDVNFVARCHGLGELVFERCPSLTSFGGLEQLQKLRALRCWDNGSSPTRAEIGSLAALERLEMSANKPPRLDSVLSQRSRIRTLRMSSVSPVDEIGELGASPALESLEIISCRGLRSLAGIGQFTHLRRLVIDDCDVASFAALEACDNIEWLKLSRCELVDPSLIARMKKLRTLELDRIPIRSLDFLNHLPALEHVTLRRLLDLPFDRRSPRKRFPRIGTLHYEP